MRNGYNILFSFISWNLDNFATSNYVIYTSKNIIDRSNTEKLYTLIILF